MHFTSLLLTCVVYLIGCTSATSDLLGWKAGWSPAKTDQTDRLAAEGLLKFGFSQILDNNRHCNLGNAAVRREWTTLLPFERKAYSDAVLCLQKKPSRLDPLVAPGAKSRYDDFVAVHVNNTFTIHATASFLTWHRLFTWTFEQALRNECGYKGYQPYWNWGKTAFDPVNSPIFDGSAYSMGGNGVYAKHNCTNALPTNENCIPPAAGGGCVETGPFKSYVVNIAPMAPTLAIPELTGQNFTFLQYYPRCLKRDVSVWVSSRWSKDVDSYSLITQNKNVSRFQDVLQGDGFKNGFFGVHSAGHYTMGGDPGGDFFASPGDPAFWLHHAQVDRTWWIWQNQDFANRQNVIAGPRSLIDPTAGDGTLDDWLEMGILGTGTTIRQTTSTTGGPFCYFYL